MPKEPSFRFGADKTYTAPDIAPGTPFWAIGDVHGRYDLLAPMLDQLMKRDEQIVLLGDYINKGPNSAAVLKLLKEATATGRVVALRGNHEELLLRYLVRPRVLTDTFLGYGGLATLHSFGVNCTPPVLDLRRMSRIRNGLRAALGDLERWISTLPFQFHSGNVTALHAGADPALPMDRQHAPSFCWGHPRFTKEPRADGRWIIHGHGPVDAVTVKQRRVAIDTCANECGPLSAILVDKGRLTML